MPFRNASPLVAPYSTTLPTRMFSSGAKPEFRGRIDDNAAAGEPLADVVVGIAFERERDAVGRNAPKLWPADPVKWKRMVSSGSPAEP